jgi:hypothetical protein
MALDMVDIAQEIYQSSKRLNNSGDALFTLAREYAEAEKTYRESLRAEIIKLKDEKMSVTLIPDIARGNVSDLKFKRDLAEYKYKAGRDKVQALQSEISALQSIYRRQDDI